MISDKETEQVFERLQRIEEKLDELIELLTESSSGLEDDVEEGSFCPRCGKALVEEEGITSHYCEA